METLARRTSRILAALEDLVAQETAALATDDFTAVLTLQDRTGPLVDFLVNEGAAYMARQDLRTRLDALQERRRQNGDRLVEKIQRARIALQETRASERRVAQVGPAYAQSGETSPRKLQAVG